MSLPRCFLAQDRDPSTQVLTEHTFPYRRNGRTSPPAAVWGVRESAYNPKRGPRVHMIADLRNSYIESYAYDYCSYVSLDSQEGTVQKAVEARWGAEIFADTSFAIEPWAIAPNIFTNNFAASGAALWRFGQTDDADWGGPVEVFIGTPYEPGGFGLSLAGVVTISNYGVSGYTKDFGIDRGNNRVFIRGSNMNAGTVSIFQFASRAHVADIYMPNETAGIMATGEGYVWVADVLGHLYRYDYNGKLWSALRDQRTVLGGGIRYGWDFAARRLLAVEGGTDDLHVYGMWPYPSATHLTCGFPTAPARKGRTSYWCANVYDDAGYGVSSLQAVSSATASTSDRDGDIIKRLAPSAAGTYSTTITVNP